MSSSITAKPITVLLLVLLAGLIGCGDDEGPTEPKEASIIGAWDLTRLVNEEADGTTFVYEGEELESSYYREYFIFNEDGTGEVFDHGGATTITWEIKSSGSIYLYYLDGGTRWIYSNYTLTECSFTTTTNWDSGGKRTEVFTRRGAGC